MQCSCELYMLHEFSHLYQQTATLITQGSDELVEGTLPGVSQNRASEKVFRRIHNISVYHDR